jgi:hypothetical protein
MTERTIMYGRNEEAELAPREAHRPYVEQIIPAEEGYSAVFVIDAEPFYTVDRVIAWGIVVTYEIEDGRAVEYRNVEALILEEYGLCPVSTWGSLFVGLGRNDRELSDLRDRAHERAHETAEARAARKAAAKERAT